MRGRSEGVPDPQVVPRLRRRRLAIVSDVGIDQRALGQGMVVAEAELLCPGRAAHVLCAVGCLDRPGTHRYVQAQHIAGGAGLGDRRRKIHAAGTEVAANRIVDTHLPPTRMPMSRTCATVSASKRSTWSCTSEKAAMYWRPIPTRPKLPARPTCETPFQNLAPSCAPVLGKKRCWKSKYARRPPPRSSVPRNPRRESLPVAISLLLVPIALRKPM